MGVETPIPPHAIPYRRPEGRPAAAFITGFPDQDIARPYRTKALRWGVLVPIQKL
jgi:hypothetical protein